MFKKIIAIGDSFTYGHGCSDRIWHYSEKEGRQVGDLAVLKGGPSEYAWPSLLQKDYPESKVYNLSMPGLDNLGMLTKLLAYPGAYRDADLIILSTTVADRMLIRDNKSHWLSEWNAHPLNYNLINWDTIDRKGTVVGPSVINDNNWMNEQSYQAFVNYLAYCHHDGRNIQTAWATVLSVYAVATAENAKFIWAPPGYCAANQNAKVLPNINCEKIDNLHDYVFNRNELLAEDRHANNLGHAEYYRNVMLPTIEKLQ